MTLTTQCRPKVHDVMFHDKVKVCPYCNMKLYPDGDYGSGQQGYR